MMIKQCRSKDGRTPNLDSLKQLVSLGAILLALCALPAQSNEAEENDPRSSYNFLESQITSGEADEALAQLDKHIESITQNTHRYHAHLFTPVLLRGDAYYALGRLPEALNEFDRARHIARVSQGLFDPSQIPAVYRQATVLREMGELAEAGRSEEYAYEVAHRSYAAYASELLEPLIRLANFYIAANNPLAARSLLNRAVKIHEHQKTTETDAAVAVLRALANTHRTERFPPNYIHESNQTNAEEVFSARLRTTDLNAQYRAVNQFANGERALQRVVEVQNRRFGNNSAESLDALLELADWHLMFGKNNAAFTLYEHIYLSLEGDAEIPTGRGESRFKEPVLLYYPRPPDLNPPRPDRRGEQRQGLVSLQFGVSPTGAVRQLKTLEIQGPENMNYRVRRSMREAVFRPRLEEGLAVSTTDQQFAYRFSYFEKIEPTSEAESETNSAEQTDAPEDA